MPLDNHLGDPVGDRRNPERPRCSSIAFRYVNPTHGWRKVTSGRHPVPDPIEVLTQIPIEVLDGLPVDTSRPSVGLHLLVRLPHLAFGNTKRLCSIHGGHPLAGCHWRRMTTPLRSGSITEPSTLLRAPPPLCPASVLGPWRRLTAWVSPFASGRQVPVFLTEACLEVTPPSCRTPVGQSAGVPQPLLAG